jgi:aminoglycoside phosphotransferase (APT) family kinase protein
VSVVGAALSGASYATEQWLAYGVEGLPSMHAEWDERQFAALAQRLEPGGRLLRVWPLEGGVSAQVTAFELEAADGRRRTMLMRRHGAVDLAHNPRIARDEFRLLQVTRAHGLTTPAPLLCDESRALFQDAFIVIEYVEGETDFAPAALDDYLARMAAELARVHSVRDATELDFLPRLGCGYGPRPAQLDDALGEGRIRDALEAAWPLARLNAAVLLHGDYWPGNLVWRDGALAAVIDWEDARVGDPLYDLANSRLELLFFFGAEALATFTARYLAGAAADLDVANLPYWDLCAALRPCSRLSTWGLDAALEQQLRERHQAFVARALGALGA